MSWAIVGGAVVVGAAGLIGGAIANQASSEAAKTQAEAATDAAGAQSEATLAAIAEQQRQFDAMQKLMEPYVTQGTEQMAGLDQYQKAGSDSLKQQRALMGLDGQAAQQAAIAALSGGAEMNALVQQGENAMLQNASATGGLRGGNIQGALAQYRPSMLSSLINNQYSKLGGMVDMGQQITMNRTALGQASAAGVGAAGMQSASSIGNLLSQQGQANANAILGAGNAQANAQLAAGQMWGNLPSQIIQGGLIGYGLKNPGTF